MSTASAIVAKIDELILAKLTGAAGLGELADRSLGDLSVTWSTSLRELRELREFYKRRADSEAGGGETETVVLE